MIPTLKKVTHNSGTKEESSTSKIRATWRHDYSRADKGDIAVIVGSEDYISAAECQLVTMIFIND